ncbi:DUF998 domain-containing protein [Haloarchaeobius sp. HRN-SO-5]|uniref:DUF998 domain-containing protein n=1 Tax=Haloarchaeobius sp. HRN-SO-5 TaxID=3446118 RepID=UPI003EBB1DB1
MTDRRRTLASFSLLAPGLALATLLLSTLVDPLFSWRSRSLSSMGEATGEALLTVTNADQVAFLLFNGGLVVGGLLGLPFAVLLWLDAENGIERAGVVAFALALLSMAGVGVAYLDGPVASLHFPFAAGFYLLATVALLSYGTGVVLARETGLGLAVLALGVAHLLQWAVWVLLEATVWTGDDVPTYFAVPEAVGAVLFGGWVLLMARVHLEVPSASN